MLKEGVSAVDAKAVKDTLYYFTSRGWVSPDIRKDDLQQEMWVKLLEKPAPARCTPEQIPGYRRLQCRGAGIDYLRKVHGRKGQKMPVDFPEDGGMPDFAGGDDPADWVAVAQALEKAMKPADPKPTKKRVVVPRPSELEVLDYPLPPLGMPSRPPSPWRAVYDSLEPGGTGRKMTPEQATAFCDWAHSAKLKVRKRPIDGLVSGVWRE